MIDLLFVPKENFFYYFGLSVSSFFVIKYLFKIANNLFTFTFGGIDMKKYGDWAIITGCTDGIGKAYAEKLAEKGLNLILLSRSLSKLNDLSENLKGQYKIKTKVVAVDFTEENEIYEEIEKAIEKMNIGVLINNVGMTYSYPEFFCEVPNLKKSINDIIHCNVVSVTKMTAIVLPGMVERGGGIIVNNGSAAGCSPMPCQAIYSSTKAYIDFFSRALSVEYKSKGIIVQLICPFVVITKMAAGMKRKWTQPTPEEYVNSSIKTIGYQNVTHGCLSHNILGWLVFEFLMMFNNSLFDSIRYNLTIKALMHHKSIIKSLNKNSSS